MGHSRHDFHRKVTLIVNVDAQDDAFDGLVKFRRFRLNVIDFLKLPYDVSEEELRAVLQRSNATLRLTYEDRAERARPRLRRATGSG